MADSSNANRRGRRATGTKRIDNELNRRVCFSKRKKGILRKAFELSVLTGAEVGIIIISEHGKVYTYGHPSIESVINKFTSENPIPSSVEEQGNQTPLNENVGVPFAIGHGPINNYNSGLQSDLQLGLHGSGLHYNVPQISAGGSGMKNIVPSLYTGYPSFIDGSSTIATPTGGPQNFGPNLYTSYPPFTNGSSILASSGGGSQNFGLSLYTSYSTSNVGSSIVATPAGSGPQNFGPSLYTSYPPSNAGSSTLAISGSGSQNFGLSLYRGYPPFNVGSSIIATSSGRSQNINPSSYTGYSPIYAGNSTLTTSDGFLQNNAQVSLFGHGGQYNFEPNAFIGGGTGGSPSIGYLPFDVGTGFLATSGLWQNGVHASFFDHGGQYIEPNSLIGGGTGSASFHVVEQGLVGGDQGVQQGIRANFGSVPQIVGATSLTSQGGGAPTIAGGNTFQGSHGDNDANDKLLG